MVWIRCKPVTFGSGHNKPNLPERKERDAIKNVIESYDPNQKFSEDVRLSIKIKIYLEIKRTNHKKWNDLDNFIKPIIDVLHEECKLFEYESQIFHIDVEKRVVKTGDEEGIDLEVKKYTPQKDSSGQDSQIA